MTTEADQLNTSNQDNDFDLEIQSEESKKREDIAQDFYNLIAKIKTSFDNIRTLRKTKIKPDSEEARKLGIKSNIMFFLLNEDEEEEFSRTMGDINESLGISQAMLDSYVKFAKATPDFEKFLNIIYIFVENYLEHRKSDFFQYHAEKEHYLYPYFQVDNVITKLDFLYKRNCGTLSVAARWIIIQPPSPPRSSGDYYDDRYLHIYDPYIDPYRPYTPERPKTRDIGDAYDGR